MLEGFPGNFEQHPLLGVHCHGLARGDAEEVGVEPGDVVDESAPLRRHPPRCPRIGVIERVRVPSIGRHLVDGVPAVYQQLPKAVRPRDIPRQPATDPNHCHRLGDIRRERRSRPHKFTREDLARLR